MLTTFKCIQMHFNVMSWIRYVIVFWTSQPHFIYLVHSRAGLQSKLCNPYSTEDNLYSKHWRPDPVCLWHMHQTWKKKTQINVSIRIKLYLKSGVSSSQLVKLDTVKMCKQLYQSEGPISRSFLGCFFLGACFPRKSWNFKALFKMHLSVVGAYWNITTVEPLIRAGDTLRTDKNCRDCPLNTL